MPIFKNFFATNQNGDQKNLLRFFYAIISSALIFTGLGAGPGVLHVWSAMTALLWALSSMAAGTAVVFLFGIPKILQGAPHVPEKNTVQQIANDTAYRQQ